MGDGTVRSINARNPRIAWDELALLEVLRDAGVPAPSGIGVSDAGFFPTPVLFIEFIEGTSEPPATQEPERAAELLAQIHRCPTGDRLAFLPGERPRYRPPAINSIPRFPNRESGRRWHPSIRRQREKTSSSTAISGLAT
ncbi:MAG: phosphotransferase [Thermomicrobiales bacterium]